MATTRNFQGFGDGSKVTFAVNQVTPLPSGCSLHVTVNGEAVPYTWATANSITLAVAPVNGAIVDGFNRPDADAPGRSAPRSLVVGGDGVSPALTINGILSGSYLIAVGQLGAGAAIDIPVSLVGARPGDVALISYTGYPPTGCVLVPYCDANDVVKIRAMNASGSQLSWNYIPTVRIVLLKL